jgi:hypothetical protein
VQKGEKPRKNGNTRENSQKGEKPRKNRNTGENDKKSKKNEEKWKNRGKKIHLEMVTKMDTRKVALCYVQRFGGH